MTDQHSVQNQKIALRAALSFRSTLFYNPSVANYCFPHEEAKQTISRCFVPLTITVMTPEQRKAKCSVRLM